MTTITNMPPITIENEDEDLRCPICNHFFTQLNKPYLLPCNHNLCISCINSIKAKKMFSCPFCRNKFDEKHVFHVNFSFLNLLIKILKHKTIFCKICKKLYPFYEHHTICDTSNFIEADQIFDEIKELVSDCSQFMKSVDKNISILNSVEEVSSYCNNSFDVIKDHLQNLIDEKVNFIKSELNLRVGDIISNLQKNSDYEKNSVNEMISLFFKEILEFMNLSINLNLINEDEYFYLKTKAINALENLNKSEIKNEDITINKYNKSQIFNYGSNISYNNNSRSTSQEPCVRNIKNSHIKKVLEEASIKKNYSKISLNKCSSIMVDKEKEKDENKSKSTNFNVNNSIFGNYSTNIINKTNSNNFLDLKTYTITDCKSPRLNENRNIYFKTIENDKRTDILDINSNNNHNQDNNNKNILKHKNNDNSDSSLNNVEFNFKNTFNSIKVNVKKESSNKNDLDTNLKEEIQNLNTCEDYNDVSIDESRPSANYITVSEKIIEKNFNLKDKIAEIKKTEEYFDSKETKEYVLSSRMYDYNKDFIKESMSLDFSNSNKNKIKNDDNIVNKSNNNVSTDTFNKIQKVSDNKIVFRSSNNMNNKIQQIKNTNTKISNVSSATNLSYRTGNENEKPSHERNKIKLNLNSIVQDLIPDIFSNDNNEARKIVVRSKKFKTNNNAPYLINMGNSNSVNLNLNLNIPHLVNEYTDQKVNLKSKLENSISVSDNKLNNRDIKEIKDNKEISKIHNNTEKQVKSIPKVPNQSLNIVKGDFSDDDVIDWDLNVENSYSRSNLNSSLKREDTNNENRKLQYRNSDNQIKEEFYESYSEKDLSINDVDVNENKYESKTNDTKILDLTNYEERRSKISYDEAFNKILSIFNRIKTLLGSYKKETGDLDISINNFKNNFHKILSLYKPNIEKHLNDVFINNLNFSLEKPNKDHVKSKKVLCNFTDKTKKVWIFDILKFKSEMKELSFLKFKFSEGMGLECNEDGSILFFTGGISTGIQKESDSIFSVFSNNTYTNKQFHFQDDKDDRFSCMFMIFYWESTKIEMQKMPHRKAFHSSLFYNNKLFIIGGNNSNYVSSKECSCYNWNDKKWELLPNLHQPRSSCSLAIYNNSILYVFRGFYTEKNKLLDSIEWLNINNMSGNPSWNIFIPEDLGLCWVGSCCSSALTISEDKIMIFGGSNTNRFNDSESYNKTTYVFNPITKSVFRSNDLYKSACFTNQPTFKKSSNSIIAIDYRNESSKMFGIHSFCFDSKKWKFIN